MTDDVGFIGDIHGSIDLLDRLLDMALPRVKGLVFLGDYVNRGPASNRVLDRLSELHLSNLPTTFLAGNHDLAFLNALDSGRMRVFLRMGGAATAASYLEGPVGDLTHQLREAVPESHIDFLRALEEVEEGEDYVARHLPIPEADLNGRFGVFGHYLQPSLLPLVGPGTASIDTGCGTLPDGRLTCFLWPSRRWIQASPSNSASV